MATVNVKDIDGIAKVAISSSVTDLVVKPSIDGKPISADTTSYQLGLAKLENVPNITDAEWQIMQIKVDQSMQQGDTLLKQLKIGKTSAGAICEETKNSIVCGFDAAGANFISGVSSSPLRLRGSEERPFYNGNKIGLLSDFTDAGMPLFTRSGYNIDKLFDTGIYEVADGKNYPGGSSYGTLLVMAYRKPSGNNKTDFANQVYIPAGNRESDVMYFRTSTSGTDGSSEGWNAWQEVTNGFGASSSLTLNSSNMRYYLSDIDKGSAYVNSNTNRFHFVFSPFFKKGTTIKFTGNWNLFDWAVETSNSPEKWTGGDRRTNDSGWITATTEAGTLSASGYYGFKMTKTSSAVTITVPSDGFIAISLKPNNSTDEDFFNSSSNTTSAKNFVLEFGYFEISGKAKKVAAIRGADNMLDKPSNPNIRSVNHRGYHESIPENTLSSFRESKLKGWKYVECDVCLTKDNVPVILHDASINRVARTSTGGTLGTTPIYVYSNSYEDLLSYSFEETFTAYRGEKIPSFKEFLILCKNLGLHPYIEVKQNLPSNTFYTNDQLDKMADIVISVGMGGKVTWISFNGNYLKRIQATDKKSRYGLVTHTWQSINSTMFSSGYRTDGEAVNNTIAEGETQTADEKSGRDKLAKVAVSSFFLSGTEKFIDGYYSKINDTAAEACIANGYELETWTVDSLSVAASLPPYVSGFTSNKVNFDNAFQSAAGFFE